MKWSCLHVSFEDLKNRLNHLSVPANWSFYNPVQITGRCHYLESLAKILPAAGNVLLVTSKGFATRGVTAKMPAAIGRKVEIYDEVQPNRHPNDPRDVLGTGGVGRQGCPTLWITNSRL